MTSAVEANVIPLAPSCENTFGTRRGERVCTLRDESPELGGGEAGFGGEPCRDKSPVGCHDDAFELLASADREDERGVVVGRGSRDQLGHLAVGAGR